MMRTNLRGRVAAIAVALLATMAMTAQAQAAARQISPTEAFSCAADSAGGPDCWGTNAIPPPASVGTVKTIESSNSGACVLKPDGKLVCFDDIGINKNFPVPAELDKVSFTGLALADDNGCGVQGAGLGGLSCWGNPATGINSAPAGSFSQVDLSGKTACAIRTTSGALECWGDAPSVPAGTTLSSVSVGSKTNVCGIQAGKAWCLDAAAKPPADLGDVTDVSALRDGSGGCAVTKSDGALVCWGPALATESALKPPASLGAVTSVRLATTFGCAVKQNGYVACWGGNGQAGGGKGASPAPPGPVPPATAKVGSNYSTEITSDNGTPAATFEVTAGALPPGLSIVRYNVLEGTPTTAGTYKFTITADNDVFDPASKEFTIVVSGAAKDSTAPVLSKPSYSAKVPGRITIKFTASEPGKLLASYARCTARGSGAAKRCRRVSSTKKGPVGTAQTVKAGLNTITFPLNGVPATYVRLSFAMVDAAGNPSNVLAAALKAQPLSGSKGPRKQHHKHKRRG